jgi:hypothetical protein
MARKTAQQRRIERLLQKQTADIQAAFSLAMERAATEIDRAALIRFLEAGNIEQAAALFKMERGILFPLENAIREAIIGGGLAVADELPKGLTGRFGFDGNHPRAAALAETQAAALVTNVSVEAIDAARKLITEGLKQNRSLNSVARDLVGRKVGNRRVGGIIGLTEPQTERMANIRSILSDPDRIATYFKGDLPRYKQSNRSFDGLVRQAIKDVRALNAADVDRIAEAYKVKAMGERGKIVARNEAFIAQASGRDEAYRQLVESGKAESATVRWQHNLSQVVFPDGVRMSHPHDPRGGAEHSIGCRCIGVYRIKIAKG